MARFLKLWLPVFGWCGLIFYLSGIPNLGTGWGLWDIVFRKAAHITEYFILAYLLYRAIKGSFNPPSFYLFFCALTLAFLYAVSDEIHQSFVPTRGPSPWDVLIDTIGIAGFYLFMKYKSKFIRRG